LLWRSPLSGYSFAAAKIQETEIFKQPQLNWYEHQTGVEHAASLNTNSFFVFHFLYDDE